MITEQNACGIAPGERDELPHKQPPCDCKPAAVLHEAPIIWEVGSGAWS